MLRESKVKKEAYIKELEEKLKEDDNTTNSEDQTTNLDTESELNDQAKLSPSNSQKDSEPTDDE